MLNEASVSAVAAASRGEGRVRPLYGSFCFSRIPGTVERLLLGGDAPALPESCLSGLEGPWQRIVLVLLDAHGWEAVGRHAEHPLLRRIEGEGVLSCLTSQFPSTTSAHVTTLGSGLPVGLHGIYEWFLYEPSLDRIVAPLRFAFAGDDEPETLRGVLAPEALFPEASLWQRLADRGVACAAAQPEQLVGSTYSAAAARGARMLPFSTPEEGLSAVAAFLGGPGPRYAGLYLDGFDSVSHLYGPRSPEADEVARAYLDELDRALAALGAAGPTLLLLTADHGQVGIDPAQTMYVDLVWPELAGLLRTGADGLPLAPAGSPRDLFLHVREGCVDEVVAGLSARLGDRAEVVRVADLVAEGLFGPEIGEPLRRRLAEVAVLPVPGESAWWWGDGRHAQRFRGHHGGLWRGEAETFLGALVL